VDRGVAFLDAAVVAAAQETAFTVEEGGPDRDATLGEALAGFLDRHGQEGLVIRRGLERAHAQESTGFSS
jgi:hypothetical protein